MRITWQIYFDAFLHPKILVLPTKKKPPITAKIVWYFVFSMNIKGAARGSDSSLRQISVPTLIRRVYYSY
ncbi:hypothetical protein Trydic_g13172 [Trypoxylus dichotomus]